MLIGFVYLNFVLYQISYFRTTCSLKQTSNKRIDILGANNNRFSCRLSYIQLCGVELYKQGIIYKRTLPSSRPFSFFYTCHRNTRPKKWKSTQSTCRLEVQILATSAAFTKEYGTPILCIWGGQVPKIVCTVTYILRLQCFDFLRHDDDDDDVEYQHFNPHFMETPISREVHIHTISLQYSYTPATQGGSGMV